MKKIEVMDSLYQSMKGTSSSAWDIFKTKGIHYRFKLDDRMAERGLTVRKLAELTGLRIATISDLMTGKKGSVNLAHITLLMFVLRISDISDLIEIYIPEQTKEVFKSESVDWVKSQELPKEVFHLSQQIKKGEE